MVARAPAIIATFWVMIGFRVSDVGYGCQTLSLLPALTARVSADRSS